MQRKKLVVLSGAGISAESGLKTFRDSADGLWNGFDIEDVATPNAWVKNQSRVLAFYNYRRQEVAKAQPNQAHRLVASLENQFEVTIITQNIDDLHERAGSTQVLHLHGEIFSKKSDKSDQIVEPVYTDMLLGHRAPDGGFWRPNIVWFGEAVPKIEEAAYWVSLADVFVVVGTSLQVYPAAGLLNYVNPGTPIYVIDKKLPAIPNHLGIIPIEASATQGVQVLVNQLAHSR